MIKIALYERQMNEITVYGVAARLHISDDSSFRCDAAELFPRMEEDNRKYLGDFVARWRKHAETAGLRLEIEPRALPVIESDTPLQTAMEIGS